MEMSHDWVPREISLKKYFHFELYFFTGQLFTLNSSSYNYVRKKLDQILGKRMGSYI